MKAILSREDLNALWARRETDPRAREALITRYTHLAKITASRYFQWLPASLDREDLESAGYVALVDAVDHFDRARGVKFETYAIARIRGGILDLLREMDWVPRLVRDQKKVIARATQRLFAQMGRPATQAELAAETGFGAQFPAVQAAIHQGVIHSIDAILLMRKSGEETDPIPITDGIDSTLLQAHLSRREAQMRARLEALPEREGKILLYYYYEDWTFKQCAEALGISESRAYQLHGQAIRRLRDVAYLLDDAGGG